MAMLAEKRKRTKYCLNPNGKDWVNDDSKFGQKILEKMGWQKGQGLGANNQGITERLKVSYKIDSRGLGFKEKDSLLQQQNDFQALLSELNDESGKIENEHQAVASLEEKSKKLKSRVHYQKFTRGKDISRYTSKDLSCILGTGLKRHSQNDSDTQGPVTENKGNLIYGGSMNSYFEEKLAKNSKNMEMEVEIKEEFINMSSEKGGIANEADFSLDHNSEALNYDSKKHKIKSKSGGRFSKEEGEHMEESTSDIIVNHGIDSSGKKKCKKSKRQKDTEHFPNDTQTEELKIQKESKSLFSHNCSSGNKNRFGCQKDEATEDITIRKISKKSKKKKSTDPSLNTDLHKLQNYIENDSKIIESESNVDYIEENKLSEMNLQNNIVCKGNCVENHDNNLYGETMGVRKKPKKRKQQNSHERETELNLNEKNEILDNYVHKIDSKDDHDFDLTNETLSIRKKSKKKKKKKERSDKEEKEINLSVENNFNKNELQDINAFENESKGSINCELSNENVNIFKKCKKRKRKMSDMEDVESEQTVTENFNKDSSKENSPENISSGRNVETENFLNDGTDWNETELKNSVCKSYSKENHDFDSGNEAVPVCEKSKKKKLESSSELSSSSKEAHDKKEPVLNDRNYFNNNELQNNNACKNYSTDNNFDLDQKTSSIDTKSGKKNVKSYDREEWAGYQQVVRGAQNNRGRNVNPKRTIVNNYLSSYNEALERKREARFFKMNAVPKFNGFVGSNLHSVKGYGESLNKEKISA